MVTRIGLVGLGKMGNNMRERIRAAGIEVTGYDPRPEVSDVATLADLVAALPTDGPRIVWVMVPAGDPTRGVVTELGGLLGEGRHQVTALHVREPRHVEDVLLRVHRGHLTAQLGQRVREHHAQSAEAGVVGGEEPCRARADHQEVGLRLALLNRVHVASVHLV